MMASDGIGLLGAFMVMFGAIAPVVAVFAWSGTRKQLGWEPVRGTIRVSEVGFDGEYYHPRIEYTYSHRGREFRGTRVRSLTMLVSWSGPSRTKIEEYPVGSEVTVFVDPEHPRESVLVRGGDPRFLPAALTLSVVLLVLGMLILGSR
jgi:hypothetical protein